LKGTNFGVGPDVFQELTSGGQNTAIGNGAGGGPYGVTTWGMIFVPPKNTFFWERSDLLNFETVGSTKE